MGGDAPATKFLAAWKKFNTSTEATAFCHSEIRDTPACFLAAGAIGVLQAMLELDFYAELVGTDLACIQQTAGQFYYDAFGSIVSFFAVLLLLN